MKWYKISNGDYPNVYDNVLVAFANDDGTYNYLMIEMATYSLEHRWRTNNGTYNVNLTDRWAYIDLPAN